MTRRGVILGLAFDVPGKKRKPEEDTKMPHAREVRVTFPHYAKKDLMDLMSTFFSKGDDGATKRLEAVLQGSDDLTMVWTTKSIGDNSIQIEVL